MRLINGSNPFEGRVEVYLVGEWKSICDINWDRNDAKTVCTMLGLPYVTISHKYPKKQIGY